MCKVVLFMFLFFFQVIQLCPCQDSGVCLGIPTPLFFVKLHTEKIRSILDPKDIKQPRKCPLYQHFRGSVRYSNSQSSICFVVLSSCFSFETVHFRTVLYVFAMFLSDCIVILLSAICYISKSTNSLKCYNTYTTFQFPYSQEVVENNILLPYLGLPIK